MNTKHQKIGLALVVIMALIQAFYAVFAYLDPTAFAAVRGTDLFSSLDGDWVKIYGSRTLFIALLLGYLVYARQYAVLMYSALFGLVMPITDAYLAYEAQAAMKVILKHIATAGFLLVTAYILRAGLGKQSKPQL